MNVLKKLQWGTLPKFGRPAKIQAHNMFFQHKKYFSMIWMETSLVFMLNTSQEYMAFL